MGLVIKVCQLPVKMIQGLQLHGLILAGVQVTLVTSTDTLTTSTVCIQVYATQSLSTGEMQTPCHTQVPITVSQLWRIETVEWLHK